VNINFNKKGNEMTHRYQVGITLTPQKAAKWLEKRNIQRTKKDGKIAEFMYLMENNLWKYPTGQTMSFNTAGELCDGQNRCLAVVRSGKTIKVDVAYDIPILNIIGIDNCTSRSYSDVLTIKAKIEGRQPKYSAQLGPAYKIIIHHFKGNIYSDTKIPSALIYDADTIYSEARESAQIVGRSTLIAPAGVCIALHYLLSRNPAMKELVNKFFESFIKGENLPTGSPILALRKKCTNARISDETPRPPKFIWWFIRAWDAYREGRMLTRIDPPENPPLII
jgi:hypothetical protein